MCSSENHFQRDQLINLYRSSTKQILESLLNKGMTEEIEKSMIGKMYTRIKKNNIYVEIEYKKIQQAINIDKHIITLQPNFHGIGLDLKELWARIKI